MSRLSESGGHIPWAVPVAPGRAAGSPAEAAGRRAGVGRHRSIRGREGHEVLRSKPFALQLTPQTIMAAVRTVHADNDLDAEARR